ncbi:MAG: hypothetical protein ACI8TQ_000617 [Planctomycetota bacterium]
MRILTLLLCIALSACSALPAQQRYGQSADRSVITYYQPVSDNYSADDKADIASFNTDGDPEVDGWAVQLDSTQTGLGWLVGYAKREFGAKVEATEFYAGGRWFTGGLEGSGYLLATLRYSKGLEVSGGPQSAEYYGYGVGIGVMRQMTDNIYLDFQTAYYDQIRDIAFGGQDVDLHGVVFSVGIAIAQ